MSFRSRKAALFSAPLLVSLLVPFSLPAGRQDDKPSGVGDWSVLLPEGKEKERVVQYCFNCHDLAIVVRARGDTDSWTNRIWSMISQGAEIPREDVPLISGYLSRHFGPDKERLAIPININEARPEILQLLPPLADQAEAIVKFRAQKGMFAKVEDLLQVDGVTADALNKVRPFVVVGTKN